MTLGPRQRREKYTRKWVDFCVKCNAERFYLTKIIHRRRRRVCIVCGEDAPPQPSKMANIPTRNPLTGRLHQSKAEASFGAKLAQARNLGLIEDVKGLDPRIPQERFRLDVYSNQAVEALLDKAERLESLEGLCRDIRRSKAHICSYLSDFSWVSLDPAWGPVGERRVVDVKGRLAGDQYRRFLLKKALMMACHGIEVGVVDKDGRERS
jgi:hypothetical protein